MKAETRRKAVLWGLTGTLVDVSGIRNLITEEGLDAFHEASATCPPNREAVAAVRAAHHAGYANIIFTGRGERHRELCEDWLRRNSVPYTQLSMRVEGDERLGFLVKRDMYIAASEVYEIIKAWDCRPAMGDLWSSLGVPVTLLPGLQEELTTHRIPT